MAEFNCRLDGFDAKTMDFVAKMEEFRCRNVELAGWMASQVVGRVVGLFAVYLELRLMPKFCGCGWNAAEKLPKCG